MSYILTYFIIINCITFIYRGVDKWKAVKGQRRISEKKLLRLVLLGGGIGALIGIQVLRHKTLKGVFLWKVYLAIVVRMGVIGYVLFLNY